MKKAETAIREDFLSFMMQAFFAATGKKLRVTSLVRVVSEIYQCLDDGSRVIVNQPARTLKSWTAKCFAAWRMGLNPTEKIMFLSATKDLAEDNVYDVRKIMRSKWYRHVFPETRISKDRSNLQRLRTTRGGGFFSGSMASALGGTGATIITIDDGNRIDDFDKPLRLKKANDKFDTEILSRFNPETGRKRKGIILNIQHRIAENDLSGHLEKEPGFIKISFPLIATRRRVFPLNNGKIWIREPGDVLMSSYSADDIRKARKSEAPPFHYFYQQGEGVDQRKTIPEWAFRLASRKTFAGPFVVSIDTAQKDTGSFNVIQLWDVFQKPYHLRKQFREQCSFLTLEKEAKKLISKFLPSAILIEDTANGTALLSRLKQHFPNARFVAINPRGPKSERLDRHRDAIIKGAITLQSGEDWIDRFVQEFAQFPLNGDDQVDATTQLLDFQATNPRLDQMKDRDLKGAAAVSNRTGQPMQSTGIQPSAETRSAVLLLGSRFPGRGRF